jgi:hypothetical protein
MGERKVLNRYIPPDIDPSIIPKFKRDRNKLMEIRMMLPFSLRCNTCGEFMYRGKKFNSKKEDIKDDDYMGIRKIRFYIKCSVCSAEITFKTDPKNSDYECESGASRNFELWRDNETTMEEEANQREEEDKYDAMKALENRTMDNKVEMDILDALDEIKSINSRHRKVDTDKVLETIAAKYSTSAQSTEIALSEEDEKILKAIKARQSEKISEDTMVELNGKSNGSTTSLAAQLHKHAQEQSRSTSMLPPPVTIIRRKRKADEIGSSASSSATDKNVAGSASEGNTKEAGKKEEVAEIPSATMPNVPVGESHSKHDSEPQDTGDGDGGGLGGLLGDYGDDDEEEE